MAAAVADGPWAIPGLDTQYELAPALWLTDRFFPHSRFQVGSFSPSGYEAYARVMFPFTGPRGQRWRWSDLAQKNGRVAHAEMTEDAIKGVSGAGRYVQGSYWLGDLPVGELEALISILRAHTTTGDRVWFAIWEGYGDMGLTPGGAGEPPIFPLGLDRRYLLYRGEVASPLVIRQRHPYMGDIWWPDDHAWVFTTDTDWGWAYVAGAVRLIESLVSSPLLEVYQTVPNHRSSWWGGDPVNR